MLNIKDIRKFDLIWNISGTLFSVFYDSSLNFSITHMQSIYKSLNTLHITSS
jgi:hypothetical protein